MPRLNLRIKHKKINSEDRGFHIKIVGPFKAAKGVHFESTNGTSSMRLQRFRLEEGVLEIKSKLHCNVKYLGVWVPPFSKHTITKGGKDVASFE